MQSNVQQRIQVINPKLTPTCNLGSKFFYSSVGQRDVPLITLVPASYCEPGFSSPVKNCIKVAPCMKGFKDHEATLLL